MAGPGQRVCDGIDNDCNGLVDEGCFNDGGSACVLRREVFDGIGDNCDGIVDNGLVCADGGR